MGVEGSGTDVDVGGWGVGVGLVNSEIVLLNRMMSPIALTASLSTFISSPFWVVIVSAIFFATISNDRSLTVPTIIACVSATCFPIILSFVR